MLKSSFTVDQLLKVEDEDMKLEKQVSSSSSSYSPNNISEDSRKREIKQKQLEPTTSFDVKGQKMDSEFSSLTLHQLHREKSMYDMIYISTVRQSQSHV